MRYGVNSRRFLLAYTGNVKSIWPIAVVLAIALAGCTGQAPKSVVGKWAGSIPVPQTADPAAKAGIESAMKGQLALDLSLKDDHSFDLTMFQRPFSGHWVESPGQISLHIEALDGVPLDKIAPDRSKGLNLKTVSEPLRFDVAADQTSLTSVPNKEGESVVVLKRIVPKG